MKNVFYEEIAGIYRLKVPFENIYTSVFLIKAEDGDILVDCATTDQDVDEHIAPALQQLGTDISKVKKIVITHKHGDHAGGLGSLCLFDRFAKNITTHFVESDDYAKDNCLMQYLLLQGCSQMFTFCGPELDGKFKNIKYCTYYPVSHVEPLDSFAIELGLADGRTIFYSGDTNDEEYIKGVTEILKPKDEFYCDTCLADYDGNVHTNIEKLKKIVPHSKRKQVYCMHLDSDKIYDLAEEYGFNVAKVNENAKQM